jgi:hypothetical protein
MAHKHGHVFSSQVWVLNITNIHRNVLSYFLNKIKMIRNLILASLILIAACKSKTKTGIIDAGEKAVKDTMITAVKDSAANTGPSIGKIDMESFGAIKLGQHFNEMKVALGPPDTKSKAVEWDADGLLHEDWIWKNKGLVLNISSDKQHTDSTVSVFSITANAPCDFKTKAGVGIGSSYAEVEAAYKKDIDPEATDKTQITVGSVYGGIIFSFKNDKVNNIFLGAAAE